MWGAQEVAQAEAEAEPAPEDQERLAAIEREVEEERLKAKAADRKVGVPGLAGAARGGVGGGGCLSQGSGDAWPCLVLARMLSAWLGRRRCARRVHV